MKDIITAEEASKRGYDMHVVHPEILGKVFDVSPEKHKALQEGCAVCFGGMYYVASRYLPAIPTYERETKIQLRPGYVKVFIVEGRKPKQMIEMPKLTMEIIIRKEHFRPYEGWEMKDCFDKSLPSKYRNWTLNGYEHKQTPHGDFYLCWCYY